MELTDISLLPAAQEESLLGPPPPNDPYFGRMPVRWIQLLSGLNGPTSDVT